MNNRMIIITVLFLLLNANAQAGPGHSHEKASQLKATASPSAANEHAHSETVTISAAMAQRAGLSVASASAGRIERHLPLYGELRLPPAQQAQVRARFPGVITEITVAIGDDVKQGQVLAYIESNDSLQRYPLLAPIAGTVVQQLASQGEYSAGEPILLLADATMLWAELKVFPAMLNDVKPGLPVHIDSRAGRIDGSLLHIVPAANKPYVLARVPLDNRTGRFAPGERISALVDAEIITVPLVVDNLALQQFEGKPVVFVREAERYEPRVLTLGRTDGRYTEVLAGLTVGELYVSANSYLVKAELEKSAAEHSH
ncbi:efflux RND transporter periplasmic adaptor subunit [Rheinheimera gaetbuli]